MLPTLFGCPNTIETDSEKNDNTIYKLLVNIQRPASPIIRVEIYILLFSD